MLDKETCEIISDVIAPISDAGINIAFVGLSRTGCVCDICPNCDEDYMDCNCGIEAHPIEADRANWVEIAEGFGERIS